MAYIPGTCKPSALQVAVGSETSIDEAELAAEEGALEGALVADGTPVPLCSLRPVGPLCGVSPPQATAQAAPFALFKWILLH